MIKDPYIGMPIFMGSGQGRCETCKNNRPVRQPQGSGTGSDMNMEMNMDAGMGSRMDTGMSSRSGADTGTGTNWTQGPKMGCGPLGDVPQLNWQGGSAGNAMGFDAMYLGSLPLASAYVPFQQWKTTYSLEAGLNRGTIFPELDLPFEGYMRKGGMGR